MLFSHSGVGDLKGTAVCLVESIVINCIILTDNIIIMVH